MNKFLLILKGSLALRVGVLALATSLMALPFISEETREALVFKFLYHVAPVIITPLVLTLLYSWITWNWEVFISAYKITFGVALIIKIAVMFIGNDLSDHLECSSRTTEEAYNLCRDALVRNRSIVN